MTVIDKFRVFYDRLSEDEQRHLWAIMTAMRGPDDKKWYMSGFHVLPSKEIASQWGTPIKCMVRGLLAIGEQNGHPVEVYAEMRLINE